jgi:hypothetical protein
VVLGDKEHPELYEVFNEGCVVDLAEGRMGDGGGDLCVENKAYFDLVPIGTSAACTDTSLRGATHDFGNTEEKLIRSNFGVEARDGEGRFDPSTGKGAVRGHQGAYHDALFPVRQGEHARSHSPQWEGVVPGGVAHLYTRSLSARARWTAWCTAGRGRGRARRASPRTTASASPPQRSPVTR